MGHRDLAGRGVDDELARGASASARTAGAAGVRLDEIAHHRVDEDVAVRVGRRHRLAHRGTRLCVLGHLALGVELDRAGHARTGVRPVALALGVDGEHLHLVDGGRREAADGGFGGRAADGVLRPVRRTCGPVAQAVAGDGRPEVVRRRPTHVERGGGRGRAGLGGRRGWRPGSRHVSDVDGDVYGGGLPLHGPADLACVGSPGLVVERSALLHADLAAGRVKLEGARGRRLACQRVAQRLGAVGCARDRVARRRTRGGVFRDRPGHARLSRDGHGAGDVPAVRVTGAVGDCRGGGIEHGDTQGVGSVAGNRGSEHARIGCRGRVGQRVAVGVLELVAHVVIDGCLPGQRRVAQGHGACGGRRVGPPGACVGPGPHALLAAHGPHLHLVGRTRIEVGEVEAGRSGRERAGVGRPGGRGLTRRDLLAVLGLVAGNGRAVGRGGRPGHVQRRVGRLAERRAGHRRRVGNNGVGVRHVDREVRDGCLALHGPVHLAGVGALRLAIEARSLLHADLARDRVDDEGARGRRLAGQRVGQRLAVVRAAGHRIAHLRAGGGVLEDRPGLTPCAGDLDGQGDVPPVPVRYAVGDRRRGGVDDGDRQRVRIVTRDRGGEHADILRGGRIAERVAVGVRELVADVVVGGLVPGGAGVAQGRLGGGRRRVGPTLPDVGPRPLAFLAGHGAHLRLVRRAGLEAGEIDAGRRRRQRAGLLVVGVGGGVRRPRRRVLARCGLLAVPGVVAGDGQAVGGGGRPAHIERRARGLAELRAGHRGRGGLPGLDVRHLDDHIDHRGVAVHRVVHLPAVEPGDHLAALRLILDVGVRRLVVDAGARLHADLARGRVDDEQARVGRVARERVAQRHVVVRRTRDRGAHRRARGGVLGDAPAGLRGDGDGRAARDLSAVAVARDVVDLRGALVEQVRSQHGAPGRAGEADPEQGGVLRGGGVGQRVAVGVLEEGPATQRRCLVPGEGAAEPLSAAREGDAGSGRRTVGRSLADVRPRPLAFLAGRGPHLRLVGRSGLQAREVEGRCRRRQRARLLVVGVGGGVVRPGGGLLALGGLLAVPGVVAGDGQAVGGGGRPGHVERRAR